MASTRRDERVFRSDRESQFYGQRSAGQRRASRSPPVRSPLNTPLNTYYPNDSRRTYGSYPPGRSYERDESRRSSHSRDSQSVHSPVAHSPLNAPTGPRVWHQNKTWVAPAPKKAVTKPPQLAPPSPAQNAPNWGGEGRLPTPASPTASTDAARITGNQREMEGGGGGDGDSAAMDMDIDEEFPNHAAPTAQMGGRRKSIQTSQPNPPAHEDLAPFSVKVLSDPKPTVVSTVENGSTTAVSASDPSGRPPATLATPGRDIETEFRGKWSHYQQERDIYLVGLVMSNIKETELQSKLKRFDDEQRKFGLMSMNDKEHTAKTEASRKELVEQISNNQKHLKQNQEKRGAASEELASLFAVAVTAMGQASLISSIPTGQQPIIQQDASSGPSHTEFAALKKEMEELIKASTQPPPAPQVSSDELTAIKKELAEVKRDLEKAQRQLKEVDEKTEKPRPNVDGSAKSKKLEDLEKQVANISKTATDAKKKASLVHTDLEPEILKLKDKLDTIEVTLSEQPQQNSEASTLSSTLHSELSKKFLTSSDIALLKRDVSSAKQDVLSQKVELLAVRQRVEKLETHSSLPELVEELRSRTDQIEALSGENNKQLRSLDEKFIEYASTLKSIQTEFQKLKDTTTIAAQESREAVQLARARPASVMLAPATTPAPAPPQQGWGTTQHASASLPAQNDRLGQIQGRVHNLEVLIHGLNSRMNNESMQPQFKAVLTAVAQQIPTGPQVLQELAQVRAEREYLANLTSQHSRQFQQANEQFKSIKDDILRVEQKVDGSGGQSNKVKEAIDCIESKVQQFKDQIEATVDDQVKELDGRLQGCEDLFSSICPKLMDGPLQSLDNVLTKENVEKLQGLKSGGQYAIDSKASKSAKAISKSGTLRGPATPRSTSANLPDPRSKTTSVVPSTRKYSERESSSTDEEPMIHVPPRSGGPSRAGSHAASDQGIKPGVGMKQKLFQHKKPRTEGVDGGGSSRIRE